MPTKRAVPWGAIAMWRASGTNAYRSIVKPWGSLIVRKMLRIEFAAGPSCAMVVNSVTPVGLIAPAWLNCLPQARHWLKGSPIRPVTAVYFACVS